MINIVACLGTYSVGLVQNTAIILDCITVTTII
jgi:hypothetical protein